MIITLVENVLYWIKILSAQNGVITTISPASIITGQTKPDHKYKFMTFRLYAMVYSVTKNNMQGRAVSAIALKLSNE